VLGHSRLIQANIPRFESHHFHIKAQLFAAVVAAAAAVAGIAGIAGYVVD